MNVIKMKKIKYVNLVQWPLEPKFGVPFHFKMLIYNNNSNNNKSYAGVI